MALSQEKIKELLGTGLTNEVVASTIGVHPSYISQLMSEESFYNDVIELRTKSLAAASVRDRGIDGIEEKLIKKIDDAVGSGMIYKPRDLLAAFATINRAVRRGVSAQQATVINNQVVTLRMSKTVVNNFKTNDHGEVVEVEGQTLVTMPAASLIKNLINSKASDDPKAAERYKNVAKYLPQNQTPTIDAASLTAKLGRSEEKDFEGERIKERYKAAVEREQQQREKQGLQGPSLTKVLKNTHRNTFIGG